MAVSTFDPVAPNDAAANWAVARRFVDAFAPHAQATPDMTVALDKGHLLNATTLVEVNPQTVGPFLAPAARRVDRVVVDRNSGAASIVAGMDGSLVPPAIPVGALPVARVVLDSSTVAISNEALFDERSFGGSSDFGALGATLTALSALDSTPGLVEQTGEAAFAKRSLGVAASTSVPTRADADARYLRLTGGALTGALTLNGAPTATLDAATKGYVDGSVQALDSRFLPLAGGTLTGALTLNGAPTANLGAATKGYVDGSVQALDSRFLPLAGGTLTGALTLSANPVQPLQAASKAYVDAALSGQAVVAASESVAGVAAVATQAEVNAGVNDGKFVTALKAATRYLAKVGGRLGGVLLPPATTVLTDAATITPDFSAGHDFTVTLGGNRTLANPINVSPNQSGSIVIKQDGTGGRTLVLGSFFKFPNGTAPSLSTAANATDRLDYWCESATVIHANLAKTVS